MASLSCELPWSLPSCKYMEPCSSWVEIDDIESAGKVWASKPERREKDGKGGEEKR